MAKKVGSDFLQKCYRLKKVVFLMYRNQVADLQLSVEDIDEDYLKRSKALLISGTALAESPSREAVLKSCDVSEKNNVKNYFFDIDYREYNWKKCG